MRSVSHARSASLLAPRRPTASCPWTRTLHTSLATPPESRSMRAASSPHCPSASHPTGDIFDQPDWCSTLEQDELKWSHSPCSNALFLPHDLIRKVCNFLLR